MSPSTKPNAAPRGAGRVVRNTLAAQITTELRALLLDGAFPAGGQLNEFALARQFDVSRGPVREAFQRLIQEGLLRSEPHRGVFVPDLGTSDIIDIYDTRKSLEIAAIRRVMARPERHELARELQGLTMEMTERLAKGEWREIADIDLHYHLRIVEEARSERLLRSYRTLQAETRLCLRIMMAGYRQNRVLIEEHERLAAFIDRGDANDVVAEMDYHFGDPVAILARAKAALRDQAPAASQGASGVD